MEQITKPGMPMKPSLTFEKRSCCFIVLSLIFCFGSVAGQDCTNSPKNSPYTNSVNTPPTVVPISDYAHFSFYSAANKTCVGYLIQYPPAYFTDSTRIFPVIYNIDGLGAVEQDWLKFCSYLYTAMRAGDIPQAFLVKMNPMLTWCDGKEPSVYPESAALELITHLKNTIPRMAQNKHGHCIIGFSAGGYLAFRLSIYNPGIIGLAFGLDASLWYGLRGEFGGVPADYLPPRIASASSDILTNCYYAHGNNEEGPVFTALSARGVAVAKRVVVSLSHDPVAQWQDHYAENTQFLRDYLRVLPDTARPRVESAWAVGPVSVVLKFNKPVEKASAETRTNYSLSSGITISAAVLGDDLRTVTLTTSALTKDMAYTLTVTNVRDRATTPNTIAAGQKAVFTYTGENVALNKTVTASSTEGSLIPANAVDGSEYTRWGSNWNADGTASPPQWLRVDFGALKIIDRVAISWESSYASSYAVQTSTDGISWKDRYTTTTGNGGRDTIPIAPQDTARFVRVYMSVRATQYGYSIFELAVNGRSVGATATIRQPSVSIGEDKAAHRMVEAYTSQGRLVYRGSAAAMGASGLTIPGLQPRGIYVYREISGKAILSKKDIVLR